MGDGRALQAGTSHNLGQNFAKAFDIQFQARDKSLQHIWGTSWGVTTRLIGGVIMTHGDDSGLVLPAAHRAVPGGDRADPARATGARRCCRTRRRSPTSSTAQGVRVMLDDRDAYTPGWKFAEWELRGVPVRLEIGPKDIEKGQVMLARRDTREKLAGAARGAGRAASRTCSTTIQQNLFDRAVAFREEHTTEADVVRRVQADDGGPPGLRHRALVRVGGVRGADQGRDAGDDPQPAARGERGRGVREVRPAGDGARALREGVLAGFRIGIQDSAVTRDAQNR